MPKRIVLMTPLVLSLIFLPGCPGVGALLGTWILTLNGNSEFGLVLTADGSVSAFAAPNTFGGDLSWEVNGTEFILRQDIGGSQLIYAGRLANDSSVSGGWVRWEGPSVGQGGTWSAVKQ